MGIDTKIILIPCIVTEMLTKEGFSVIAVLICILGELPKDDRVASFRFLKSTPRRYGNSKKNIVRTVLHSYRSLPPDQGRRQRGEQWCPAPPFEIGAPHLTFGPPVAAYIQYCIFKIWPPFWFWPLFLVFGPPATKSWRRACTGLVVH